MVSRSFKHELLRDNSEKENAIKILLRNISFEGELFQDRIIKAENLVITYEPGLGNLLERFSETIKAAESRKNEVEILNQLKEDYKNALSTWANEIQLCGFFGLEETISPNITVILDWFPYPQAHGGDYNSRNDDHNNTTVLKRKLERIIGIFLSNSSTLNEKKILMAGERFVSRQVKDSNGRCRNKINIGLNNNFTSRPYEPTMYEILHHIKKAYSSANMTFPSDHIRISKYFPSKKRKEDHEIYKVKSFSTNNKTIELG